MESSPAEKDLGILEDEMLYISQLYPGLYQKECGQQGEGGDSAPLLRCGHTPSGILHPALKPPSQDRH